ncbi:MAG: fumarylacetoacetate hydrolase family protein, partial [Rhodospirillaceae bacterium]|nr:fumarylacetoacetate hydrolase family protein [Rhodospirillaceae bacterium]MBT5779383.1 fumarylacetoacetate hydrolase family protein [Rhodospirillaceae bacterium]MBT6831029.1 fumarylacetoacetate hydrolase family protein [Rhodospirillaceae bacterium]
MRLARYDRAGEDRLAIVEGDELIDILDAVDATGGYYSEMAEKRAWFADMTSLIAAGPAGVEYLQTVADANVARMAQADVKLLAPLDPGIILCSGENYWDHREEKPEVTAKEPEFFIKIPATGVIGPGDDIVWDTKVTQKLDYETELAIVIGKAGRHIAEDKAAEHIFGFTIMNDVTARDRQVKMRPDGSCQYALGPGKNFDTCAPLGPVIVTPDEISDPQNLALSTLVNGELRQNNSTAKMIWGVAELVHFFSTFLTLQPGWVISTG